MLNLLQTWADWEASNRTAYLILVWSVTIHSMTLGVVLTIVALAIAKAWRG